MPKSVRYGVYNPLAHNGTLNHAALDYTVQLLDQSRMKFSCSLSRITRWCTTIFKQGRLTGTTLRCLILEEEYGAIAVNWFWESWEQGMQPSFEIGIISGMRGESMLVSVMAEMLNEHMG